MIADTLNPRHFTSQEIAACRWLEECGVRGWMLDLADGSVTTTKRKYNSLVRFAKHYGWKPRKEST